MNFEKKLTLLTRGARYDLTCNCGESVNRKKSPAGLEIYPSVLPDGKRVNLLKILLSNACEKNCKYCENRSGRDFPTASIAPEELAKNFIEMQQRGLVSALFLSSAISGSSVTTMDKMIAAVEVLRKKYQFKGYIHLKILPSSLPSQIEKAGELATRISINIEVPSGVHLKNIAPDKNPEEIINPIRTIKKLKDTKPGRWAPAGWTSQFIVGASEEKDCEILKTSSILYEKFGASRIYFSGFQPAVGTPLENKPPCHPIREHRLYQCDFLIRRYGFRYEEIIFEKDGNLATELDPKMVWATKNQHLFPVEINSAEPEVLLRVPGIGPKTAKRIVRMRKKEKLKSPRDIAVAGVIVNRAAPFLLVNSKYLPHQLEIKLKCAQAK